MYHKGHSNFLSAKALEKLYAGGACSPEQQR